MKVSALPCCLGVSLFLLFQQGVSSQEESWRDIPLCAVGTEADRSSGAASASLHRETSGAVALKKTDPDRIHVIDIAFIYPGSLQNMGKLHQRVRAAVLRANVIFARSGVNARLRTVAVQPDHRFGISLEGVGMRRAGRLMQDIPLDVRAGYGADLLYALTNIEVPKFCGVAYVRDSSDSIDSAARWAAVGAIHYGNDSSELSCLGDNLTLVHEVGHNLGLLHDIENSPSPPFVPPFGRGWKSSNVNGRTYITVMGAYGAARFSRFSSDAFHDGLQMGSVDANASEALLYTIEDASNYSPTIVRDPVPAWECTEDRHRACLQDGRFSVEARVSFTRSSGEGVVDRAAGVKEAMLNGPTKTASLFWFFAEDNPELLVKVVNGCHVTGRYWVFGSAATDLDYSVLVTDNATGVTMTWRRDSSDPLINDTAAFPCDPQGVAASAAGRGSEAAGREGIVPLGSRAGGPPAGTAPEGAARLLGSASAAAVTGASASATDHGCLEWGINACLQDGRFFMEASYRNADGEHVDARIKDALVGDASTLFYFFEHDNPELLVKVLDGCEVNGHYWVFGSAATDLDYEVVVRDMRVVDEDEPWWSDRYGTRYKRSRSNPLIKDITAFRCEPPPPAGQK